MARLMVLCKVINMYLGDGGCPEVQTSPIYSPSFVFLHRNPMNLERMLIGYKPKGFLMEKSKRNYWNRLDLSITSGHTTAVVKHWTGRVVCKASTKEWAVKKFLYNYTDAAALQIVAKVLCQRALQERTVTLFIICGGQAQSTDSRGCMSIAIPSRSTVLFCFLHLFRNWLRLSQIWWFQCLPNSS